MKRSRDHLIVLITIIIITSGILPILNGASAEDMNPENSDIISIASTAPILKWNSTSDFIFIHHSNGRNWLNSGLHNALLGKTYIDERNDIYYDEVVSNDSGRPRSLGAEAGDRTNMNHWILWFNDYLKSLKTHECSDGINRIIMFKSCYPRSNVIGNGTEPGNPFTTTQTIANYKAVYRYYNSTTSTYSRNSYTYKPLERIFKENPDILFIPVTAPPRHYGPSDATNDAEGHRARIFNNWLKNDWLQDYNKNNPGLNNVAVFDWFDFLAFPDNHSSYPNRLKTSYGGNTGDSHPNNAANTASTVLFATGANNFLDTAWNKFNNTASPHQWPMLGGNRYRNRSTESTFISNKGEISWNLSTGGDILSSVSISEHGDLYFGSNDTKIYSVHSNGTVNWTYDTGGEVVSTPTIGDNGDIYAGSLDGKLYSLHSNGTMKWNRSISGMIYSSPVTDFSGNMIFSTSLGSLYSIASNGTEIWNTTLGSGNLSSPTLDQYGNIYIGSAGGKLYSLYSNGSMRWNFSSGSAFNSSPSFDGNDTVFIGCDNGRLYAIGLNGTEKWNYSSASRIRTSPSIAEGKMIVFGTYDGYIYSLLPNGTLNWRYQTGDKVLSSAVIDGSYSIFVGSDSGYIYQLFQNGTLSWRLNIGHKVRSAPSMDKDGYLYVGSNSNRVYCIGITEPDPPTDLNYTSGSGWINITWVKPLDNGGSSITHYSIYRGNGVTDPILIGNSTGGNTFYNDTTIETGKFYSYSISSINRKGGSVLSENISLDLVKPVFGDDLTEPYATTGDPHEFRVNCSDAHGSVYLFVEYWFGTGIHTNSSMILSSGSFTLTIVIPNNSTDDLKYRFHAVDSANNRASTDETTITVSDNDAPVFGADSTPSNGTTGDPFTFSIRVFDNLMVSNVHVEYWFGTGAHTNTTMIGASNTYTFSMDIPNNGTDGLYYLFRSVDISGNWATTSQASVQIHRKGVPVFGQDHTPTAGTTGDPITLSIQVTDQNGITNVYAEYWFGTGSHTNSTMDGDSDRYNLSIDVPVSNADDLHYIFRAVNTIGSWANTTEKTVDISDDDAPVFSSDHTPASGFTGDSITLSTTVTDNIAVSNVFAEYWFGTGARTNTSMTLNTGRYTLTLTLPSNSIDSMHYIFHATDSAGNWMETAEKTVSVTDNDKPEFGDDNSPSTGTTGDQLTLDIQVADNIDVQNVFAEYWFGTGARTNSTMTLNTGRYTLILSLPSNSIDSMYYIFHATDSAGNWIETDERTISISDNDDPEFGDDNTPSTGTTGDPLSLIINASDNIGIQNVFAEYWFGTGSHTNSTMTMNSGRYSLNITMPVNSTDSLYYLFHAVDNAGNWIESDLGTVTVFDNDAPEFGNDYTPSTGTTGDPLTLIINTADNIGIQNVFAEYWFGVGARTNSTMTLNSGRYTLDITIPSNSTDSMNYIFHASDGAGNWKETAEIAVLISDNDAPEFGIDDTPSTGTTGDPFTLIIQAADNIEVMNIYAEYWFGTGTRTNSSMTLTSGRYMLAISIPGSSTDDLFYIFHSVDRSDNWKSTTAGSSVILDDDEPDLVNDRTETKATTGDLFIFSMEIDDNIGVEDVRLLYQFGVGPIFNVSMELNNGDWTHSISIPGNSIEPLKYWINAVDGSDNWLNTIGFQVEILDNDPPELVDDLTTGLGYTGEIVGIHFEVEDNIGIESVFVEHWFGDGVHENTSISGTDGMFQLDVDIMYDEIHDLNYIITSVDASGNWMRTMMSLVQVFDNDLPYLVEDLTQHSATTGDPFTFTVKLHDNINIDEATVEYWFGDAQGTNTSIIGSDTYELTIQILPDEERDLKYMFHFSDEAGNWNSTTVNAISVQDNDPPQFVSLPDQTIAYTGSSIMITIDVMDNIGISNVSLVYWFGDVEERTKIDMIRTDGLFSGEIDIPLDSTEDLQIIASTFDVNGLGHSSERIDITVIDDVIPTIQMIEDQEIYLGQTLTIPIDAEDNIGIFKYELDGMEIIIEEGLLVFRPEEIGMRDHTISVTDQSGNQASTSFSLLVYPLNHDTDEDGIPDLIEDEIGLDFEDPNDSMLDPDEDGLNNIDEIANGTDPNDSDSDEDGIPDGWEVQYQLDPLSFSADNDEDKDGKSDLEEFLSGTDPTISSKGGGSGGWIIVLLILLALIIIAASIAAIFIIRKKRTPLEKTGI